MRRRLAAVLATAVVVAGLSGCTLGGGSSADITARAVFADVGDLTTGAQVQMAGIPVGSVSAIALDGTRALVTLSIERRAHVPADVTAEIARTTILGEQYVDLVPGRRASGLLADHAMIGRTRVVPDVEQLISAGAQVFGSISTSQLAGIIAAGGQGFGGQEASLRHLLNDFSTVTAGYASRTAQITTVIKSLDQLGASMAPNSAADAQSLTNLSHTVAILAQQSSRFDGLLQALDNVSVQGRSILEGNMAHITDQLQALAAVSTQLAQHQQSLAGLLEYLPMHNATLNSVAVHDYLQVLQNIIVCGIPGGGESSAPAFTCSKGGGS
ncbi:MAG: MCE family protein [Acidimicrobiales bacterium]